MTNIKVIGLVVLILQAIGRFRVVAMKARRPRLSRRGSAGAAICAVSDQFVPVQKADQTVTGGEDMTRQACLLGPCNIVFAVIDKGTFSR